MSGLKKTNIVLRKTIEELRRQASRSNAPIWGAVAEELSKPTRRRRAVNVSRINRHTAPGDIVVVPGKVLGAGDLDHPVTVAAFSFSKTAIEKIVRSGGRVLHIMDLLRENPSGSNVKIIG
ncbi:50S ribosomal protein L18e [Desulfurococcus mucosus]|uniref:Large ribosomal subunit protein eL18 n=1 Tax=Desulfurococcus mucosus (strain ATCC 35584 / DSM 2162 / JCM 9187 / O7/1) TaxID=765177 RepID=E8R7Q3_DESM0|nr:50S ribosomal protein L18e [Desulfurococcus mucosus]ADV65647.1 LSU ribosomal protein L18AE [Desulfurococcus mucosus DSM 2162]